MLGTRANIRRPMTMGVVFGRSGFCNTRSVEHSLATSPSGDRSILSCTKLVVLKFHGRTRMTSVRFTRSVLLLLILFALAAGPASCQITSQSGAVRIIVVDAQGASVSGAKVML